MFSLMSSQICLSIGKVNLAEIFNYDGIESIVAQIYFFSLLRQCMLIKVLFFHCKSVICWANGLRNLTNLLSKIESFCHICILHKRQFVERKTS